MKLAKLDFMRLDARSGWYKKLGVGNKARLLNHALKSGLPVPNGLLLLDNAWQRLIDDGLMSVEGGNVTIEAADELLARLALHRLRTAVAVRAAFSADPPQPFTQLNIAPDDKIALLNALISVWQAPVPQTNIRRDILVMEMVNPQIEGIAFTETAFEDDLVQVADKAAQTFILPKVKSLEPSRLSAGWQRRLQLLLRGVRLTFNLQGAEWEIAWADDGERCWLLQVRPIITPPQRHDTFTQIHQHELFTGLESPLMTSVLLNASSQLTAWYRQFDQAVPTTRPMMAQIDGQVRLNRSLLTDMLRSWGLPTDTHNRLNLVRVLRKTITLSRLGWSQRQSLRRAEREPNTLLTAVTERQHDGCFADYGAQLTDLIVTVGIETLNLTHMVRLQPHVAQRMGDARLVWREQAQIAYQALQTNIQQQGAAAVARGQLPTIEDVWLLTLEEWRALDEGRVFSAEFFTQRRTDEIYQYQKFNVSKKLNVSGGETPTA